MVRNFKVCIFVICFLWSSSAWSLEIYLKNGDKITGTVVGEDQTLLLVKTLAAGTITIDKSFVDFPRTYPQKYLPVPVQKVVVMPAPPPPPPVQWKNDFSLGYTQTGGNTKKQLGQISSAINRKTSWNETSVKFNALYSSTNGVMDAKNFYGMLRYAYSFGENLQWYNFYKLEGDQDRFADIHYRITPSVGVGYWLTDTDDLKAMAELGVGYQYTNYYTQKSMEGPVLVPRFMIDKRLIAKLHLSEDLTLYPSLDNFNDYRFRSETDLINQITDHWSFKVSYIDEFNSDPPPGIKKTDYSWITSLEYHF